jgi:hypothetical protein
MTIDEGILMSDMKDKIALGVLEHWNEFFELLQIEKDECTQNSQRGFDRTLMNFKGFSGPWLDEKPTKREN